MKGKLSSVCYWFIRQMLVYSRGWLATKLLCDLTGPQWNQGWLLTLMKFPSEVFLWVVLASVQACRYMDGWGWQWLHFPSYSPALALHSFFWLHGLEFATWSLKALKKWHRGQDSYQFTLRSTQVSVPSPIPAVLEIQGVVGMRIPMEWVVLALLKSLSVLTARFSLI